MSVMVDRKKTPSILIEQIRAAILDGLYKPEERLMEADVAAQFHVSRSPVREALQALESEGTLVATPYAGAVVRPLSPAEACEIAEIRLGLIPELLRGTIERMRASRKAEEEKLQLEKELAAEAKAWFAAKQELISLQKR
jgi:DNA-binding GntR family transcriptional regulator